MKSIEELSYDAGYYAACKSNGCHRALRHLRSDEFHRLPVGNIDPESYQSGFEFGLREVFRERQVSEKFQMALNIASGRGVSCLRN